MFKIALMELRRRRWSRKFFFVLIILAVVAVSLSIRSISEGVKVDRGIYTINVHVDDPKFVVSENPDVVISNGYVFVRGDVKSLSAFDELRNYLRRLYNEWIYEKFDDSAFPVLLRIVKIPTKTETFIPKPKNVIGKGVVGKVVKVVKRKERKRVGMQVGMTQKILVVGNNSKNAEVSAEFITPEQLKPPSLLKKIIYAFAFVIPVYFVVQVYSSSAIEDKIKRRLDLLFVAEEEWKVFVGKMLPYFVLSTLLAIAILTAFGRPLGIFLLIPIILFMLALSTFTAMISRSYVEMTFLTIVLSILVTTYLFVPAIFNVMRFSKISPITLLLEDEYGLKDYLIATLQFYVMSLVLFYLSLNSTEVMHSKSSPIDKIVQISLRTVNRYELVLIASLLSIPFVFFIEFFTLSFIFAFRYALILVILLIGVIEEFFKSVIIYSGIENGLNPYVCAFLSAIGFFLGEKSVLFSMISVEYVKFALIPLLVHLLASIIFVLALRFGFTRALIVAASIHAIYDGVVLCLV